MKFSKVIFTHPITVFAGEHDYGNLNTKDNPSGRKVDSLEADGHWLVVRRGGTVKAIPAAKVESADVLEESAPKGRPAATAVRA